MHNPLRLLTPILGVMLLSACVIDNTRIERPAPAPVAAAHDNLDATLWMQTAAEHDAAVLGTYAAARVQLDAALNDARWDALPAGERSGAVADLPPAIITDADETFLDNSAFQARRILGDKGFVYADWLAWVSERRARLLPGAFEFFHYAAERGVRVYFVTNRDAPAETQATLDNLRALGLPVDADGSNLMLRGDPRAPDHDKGERRRWIGARHRVLLVLGDNLGDFLDGSKADRATRAAMIEANRARWGRQWFMLPNPAYGGWEGALLAPCGERAKTDPHGCKREALRSH